MTSMNTAIDGIWERQGPRIFAWSGRQGVAKTVLGTTAKNIFDTSFTAYGADAPGFWHRTKDRGQRASDVIPGVAWIYATDTGNNGEVTFVTSDGTIATISTIVSGAAYYTVNLNTSAPILD